MYTVIDFETTGLDASKEQVIEIGAVKLTPDFKVVGKFEAKVALNEGQELSEFIQNYTGIKHEDLEHGLPENYALLSLCNFIGEDIIVAQFASFDLGFLHVGDEYPDNDFICTKSMFNLVYPKKKAGLKEIVKHYGIQYENHHQALADAVMTAKAFKQLKSEIGDKEYINVMTEQPDRPLKYVPQQAIVTNY